MLPPEIAERLKLPIVKFNSTGRIIYKNPAAKRDSILAKKRNILKHIPQSEAKKLSLRFENGGAEVVRLSNRFGETPCISVFENRDCTLFFARSVSAPTYGAAEERFEDKLASAFLSAISLQKSKGCGIERLISDAAAYIFPFCYPSGELFLTSLDSFTAQVSELIFRYKEYIQRNFSENLCLSSPQKAFYAVGEGIEKLYASPRLDSELFIAEKHLFFIVGREKFDCGEVICKSRLEITKPYNYSVSDSFIAHAAACCGELAVLRILFLRTVLMGHGNRD